MTEISTKKPARITFTRDGEHGGWTVYCNGNVALRLVRAADGTWIASERTRVEFGSSVETAVGMLHAHRLVRQNNTPARLRPVLGRSFQTVGELKAELVRLGAAK